MRAVAGVQTGAAQRWWWCRRRCGSRAGSAGGAAACVDWRLGRCERTRRGGAHLLRSETRGEGWPASSSCRKQRARRGGQWEAAGGRWAQAHARGRLSKQRGRSAAGWLSRIWQAGSPAGAFPAAREVTSDARQPGARPCQRIPRASDNQKAPARRMLALPIKHQPVPLALTFSVAVIADPYCMRFVPRCKCLFSC